MKGLLMLDGTVYAVIGLALRGNAAHCAGRFGKVDNDDAIRRMVEPRGASSSSTARRLATQSGDGGDGDGRARAPGLRDS